MKAFYNYVSTNFKPPSHVVLNGNIYVTFVVEKDGSITSIKVARDLGYGTGQEAERILTNSPRWKPAMQNGRFVRARFSLPIKIVSIAETPKQDPNRK
jgi:TonB-like protein